MNAEKSARLPTPYEHVTVTYPYAWPGIENALHVRDDHTGTGRVYAGAYARQLALSILSAIGETDTP